MNKIKNCPFCNGESKIKRCGLGYFRAICDQCKIGTSHCASIEIAIEKWNRRWKDELANEELILSDILKQKD